MTFSVTGAARSALGGAIVAVLAGVGAPVWAAEQAPAKGTIEEIIVTGTKRAQSVQDVPISISAISEDQLRKTFRNDILAVGEMTPGVTLGQQPGFRAVAGGIRGTGQNSILVTQDSSVVLLYDDYALTDVQAQFVEMFDVERIEVYRGPQGTLFGKSATGGAISIITKRPEMNELTGDVRYQYGAFAGDDGPDNAKIQKTSLAINVPLIDDKLALRLVGLWDTDEGYYENSKRTATFPNSVPLYNFLGRPGLTGTNPAFPSELDTRTAGSGQNLNDTDVFAGKIKLLFTPTDNYEAYLMFDYADDNSGTVPGINESEPSMLLPLLGFPSVQQAGWDDILSTGVTDQCPEGNSDGLCVKDGMHVTVRGINLQQTLKVGDYNLKLITGHREQEEVLANTYTGEAFTSLFDASRNTTKESTQVELRLTSDFDGPFNFVSGASWAQEEVDMLAYATVGLSSLITFRDDNPNDGIPGPTFKTDENGNQVLNLDLDYINDPGMGGASQDRDTYAFYADGSYDFAERWTLSAGVRFTKDEKDFLRRANAGGPCTALTPARNQVLRTVDGQVVCQDSRSNSVSRVGGGFSIKDLQPFDIPLPGTAFGINEKFNDSWDEITYRVVLDYDIADVGMVYASYATGFIPGGFTETCSSLATCAPFDSETNWNAEVGFKGQFLDNTVQVNGSLFYTEYEDLIRSQVVPFTDAFGRTTQETINVNAGTSQVTGLELETVWMPEQLSGLTLSLNVGWMDAEYDEFTLNVAGVPTDFSDKTVPFTPDWRGAAQITYEHGTAYGSFTYNLSANYQDEAEMSVFNSPLTQMEKRTLVDANVTWHEPEERYYLSLWGKNLTDERNRIGANSVAGLWNFTMYGRPLSYGLEAGVTF